MLGVTLLNAQLRLNTWRCCLILGPRSQDGRNAMTIDKSLKVKRGLVRTRNVLTRAERIAQLQESDRWKEGDSVLGLPKVRVMKLALKKKKKAKKEEDEEGGEGGAETPSEDTND